VKDLLRVAKLLMSNFKFMEFSIILLVDNLPWKLFSDLKYFKGKNRQQLLLRYGIWVTVNICLKKNQNLQVVMR
jgi:hypothetical protein